MSEAIKNAWARWRLIYFKVGNGWFLAVAAAFLGYTDGTEWQTPGFKIVRMVLFCLLAGGKFLDGFFDKTFGEVRAPVTFTQSTSNIETKTTSP